MSSFLSRWSSNGVVEPSRLLFIAKKIGGMNNGTSMLLRNARPITGNTLHQVFTRNISTTCRFHVSFVYQVTLKTGDKVGSGTDSSVYLRMIGALGSTDEIMLKTQKTDLERGSVDQYSITSDDVGPLRKIIIRHDNTGFAPGWFLDWVRIRDGKGKLYNFKCDNWLIKGETYGNIKLLKEDRFVDPPSPSDGGKRIGRYDNVKPATEVISDLVKSSKLDKQVLEDVKDLENVSASGVAGTTDPKSMKHATSLSPAVRNLLDTYDIDMFKISSSGRYSRILKGDVLAYIAKENITKKKFIVNMIHPIEPHTPMKHDKKEKHSISDVEPVSIAKIEDNYLDHIANENKQLYAQELKMSKLEVPHLYMSINCSVDNLDTFATTLESNFSDHARNIVLVRILCKSLLDTFHTIDNGSMDILVTHNGNSVLLKNCNDADIENIYQQYKYFEENNDDLVIPHYGLNIVDADGVCQLSSILRVGQVLSLNISGTKFDIGADGKLTKSVVVAISCDSRIISEVTCALLLVNCKQYFSDPNLLGL